MSQFSSLFFLFLGFIFIITIAATWHTASIPNNNIIFGVTLPKEKLQCDAVNALKKKYKKLCSIYFVICTASYLPIIFFSKSISFAMIYLFAWIIFALIFSMSRPFLIVHRQLKEIKAQNGWFTGIVHEITIDTEATRLKNAKTVPVYWFIGAFIISLIPILNSALNHIEISLLITAFSELSANILFLLIYFNFKKLKASVVSENSSINVAISSERQRLWSFFWVSAAYINSFTFLLIYFMLINLIPYNTAAFTAVICISTALTLYLIIYISNKIKKLKSTLIECDKHPIIRDDDEYWKEFIVGGLVYCNPNDSSTFVEKRIGIGSTVNVATTKGKLFCYGGLVFAAAVFIAVISLILPLDTAKPLMNISNSNISISCPMYNTKFKTSDIENISIVDKMSSGLKTNGAATEEYSRGNFSLKDYGKCKLYIYNNNPPYIAIKLKNSYVFFNYEDKNETLKLYEKLKSINK